ncbi:MAG: hypothetical protein U9O94_01825 [Nanoarchaeota archaeon]|nr:hypothetical protein [Nanoarchaeota archaeon]
MPDTKDDLKKDIIESENKDDIKEDQPVEGDEPETPEETLEETPEVEDEVIDDEKQEDPYEKKLEELEAQSKRKSTALVEKNKKIKDLKKKLEDSGDYEDIEDQVNLILDDKLASIKEKEEKLDEALELAQKSNVNSLINDVAENRGEAKIIKHFLTEVGQDLPLSKQISQATILAKNAMSDEKFKADVEKANQQASSSSKVNDSASLPTELNDLANQLFDTKEGKAKFKKLLTK